jgi:uncharacterized protein YebE (UPF0316 family)
METSFFDSDLFSYLILPLLIFVARICDVALGTMRIIFTSKGKRNIAPFLGFFEVLIWITAISRIMQNMDNYLNYIAYAGGFATGNFVGMLIEERLAVGIQLIRVITQQEGNELVHVLNEKGYGATIVEAHGAREKVHLIYSIVQRNDIGNVISIINNFDPKVFYSVEDVRATSEGVFPAKNSNGMFPFTRVLRRWRGGK